MIMLKTKYLPRCYGLSWDNKDTALLFKIEKRLISRIQKLFRANTPLMDCMFKTHTIPHNFYDFGEYEKSFGFENRFVYESENEYEIVYRWKLTPEVYQTQNKCDYCEMFSLNSKNDLNCRFCRKTGKEIIYTKDSYFQSGMLTLYSLTNFLGGILLEERVGSINNTERKQIIHIEFSQSAGIGTSWITAWVAKEILTWIKNSSSDELHLIEEAMISVEEKIWLNVEDRDEFRLYRNKGGNFWLKLPGSECSLGSNSGAINLYGTGESLVHHNVDNQTQQMCFIAGIASLSDQIID